MQINGRLLKRRILKLNPLAVFYFFCLTVVTVRGSILLSEALNHFPAIYVRGWHIHHFVFGFLCLLLVLDELQKPKWPIWVLELLCGIALGLMFDEFTFWTMGRFDYWSMNNLFAMATLSITAGALSHINQDSYHIYWKTKPKHIKKIDYSFKRQVMLPWASFVGVLVTFFVLK